MLEVCQQAPTFSLPDQSAETVSLADYHGSRVVLYFYPRADTPGCTAEACRFRDRWQEYEDRDVAVLGVSDDPLDDAEGFAAEQDLPFRPLSDEDGEVTAAYDSSGEKDMFGNTFDGVFPNTYFVDEDGEIAVAYEGVDPEDHADEILADLDG